MVNLIHDLAEINASNHVQHPHPALPLEGEGPGGGGKFSRKKVLFLDLCFGLRHPYMAWYLSDANCSDDESDRIKPYLP